MCHNVSYQILQSRYGHIPQILLCRPVTGLVVVKQFKTTIQHQMVSANGQCSKTIDLKHFYLQDTSAELTCYTMRVPSVINHQGRYDFPRVAAGSCQCRRQSAALALVLVMRRCGGSRTPVTSSMLNTCRYKGR